ncbi:MAG: DedA family protein [Terriglobales bacterium]
MEAWLALPGEAMIALAASTMGEAYGLVRMAVAGVAGMLVNDFILFLLSRAGRDVLVHWIGLHHLHFHLSSGAVLGAQFFPPLRSAAYVIYGLQGASLQHFLTVAAISSFCWVGLYLLVGHGFRRKIARMMHWLEARGKWATAAEVVLTLALVAAIWI